MSSAVADVCLGGPRRPSRCLDSRNRRTRALLEAAEPSGSPSTANATSSVCGSVLVVRARSSGCRCSPRSKTVVSPKCASSSATGSKVCRRRSNKPGHWCVMSPRKDFASGRTVPDRSQSDTAPCDELDLRGTRRTDQRRLARRGAGSGKRVLIIGNGPVGVLAVGLWPKYRRLEICRSDADHRSRTPARGSGERVLLTSFVACAVSYVSAVPILPTAVAKRADHTRRAGHQRSRAGHDISGILEPGLRASVDCVDRYRAG